MSKQTIVSSILLALSTSSLAFSAGTVPDRFDRPLRLIHDARDAFRKITTDDVASAKAEAVEEMTVLSNVLDNAGQNGKDWKKYLLWKSM